MKNYSFIIIYYNYEIYTDLRLIPLTVMSAVFFRYDSIKLFKSYVWFPDRKLIA